MGASCHPCLRINEDTTQYNTLIVHYRLGGKITRRGRELATAVGLEKFQFNCTASKGLASPFLFIQARDWHCHIHSDYFYSASSSPLLLRGAPDTVRIL